MMETKHGEDLERIGEPDARGLTCMDSFLYCLAPETGKPLRRNFNGYIHAKGGNLAAGGRERLKILASLLGETQKGVV